MKRDLDWWVFECFVPAVGGIGFVVFVWLVYQYHA